MPLDPNVHLAGDLNNYRLEGDEMHAMNEVYERLSRQGVSFLSGLDADARIGSESGLRHWTSYTYGWTVFFRADNTGGAWTITVYAHGKHTSGKQTRKTMKSYNLFTFEDGKRARPYSF